MESGNLEKINVPLETIEFPVRGVYKTRDGMLPKRMCYLHPDAIRSFYQLQRYTDFKLRYSDIFRKPESSFLARKEKGRSVAPPGKSGHNYGVSFDIDVVPLNLVAKKDPRKINLDSLSKYERIKTVIQGKLETGRLMVLKDSDNPGEGCSDLIMNIEQYPDIWHDDPIDAAQMLTRMVFSEIGRGQTRRRLPKPGY